jgi:hypothetical protein
MDDELLEPWSCNRVLLDDGRIVAGDDVIDGIRQLF